MLAGRRIVLGVSGGVAAFKAAYLARRLVERGAEVRTMMTRSAHEFLGPQTLAAITGTPPKTDLFGTESVSPHTELARWADLMVVAPATAATLARLATGLSENFLSTTVLAFAGPVVVAPAMHTEMWEQPSTQRNVVRLEADGIHLVGPEEGALAGGDEGPGRMSEPEAIVDAIELALGGGALAGTTVLVSAGGTREPIDPVRYLGNRSSGKMGTAMAEEAAARGARVTLVTTSDIPVSDRIEVVGVETADDMAAAVWERAASSEVAVLAAAVADFKPDAVAEKKMRRASGPPSVSLVPTPDILAGVVERSPSSFLVGFAAETGPASGARDKAESKGVDLLVANDVTQPDAGFGTDTNRVTVIRPSGDSEKWPLMTKRQLAVRLWDLIQTERDPN
ncbi:MAG: bifunctional phosphopantothenoylcysteine decarboxylase/phosphopantothenate--cysteine ligase CoaBC [Acidimicrobiia bacterium]